MVGAHKIRPIRVQRVVRWEMFLELELKHVPHVMERKLLEQKTIKFLGINLIQGIYFMAKRGNLRRPT